MLFNLGVTLNLKSLAIRMSKVSKANNHTILEGEKVAKLAMLQLLFMGALKFVAGLLTGITVMVTDAISTFADILGVFASYIGLKLSRKNADAKFEYGYYKIETLAALVISIGIIYLGYVTLKKSILTFDNTPEGSNHLLGVIASCFAIFQSYHLSRKLQKAGEKANSLALIASAQDKKMDVIASAIVLLSVIANYKHIPYIESVVSIIIGIFILKVGIFSAKESLFFLLDYWNDPVLSRKIRKTLFAENDLVIGVKKIRLRRAGTFIFGEAFVSINPFADIQDLKSELKILKKKVEDLNPYLKDFSIYSHVPDAKKFTIAIPVKSGKNLNAKIAQNLKETSAYIFVNIYNQKIQNFHVKNLSYKEKKIIQLSNFLKKEKVNILLNNKLNSLIYYNLRRAHQVLIYPLFSGMKTVDDVVKTILIDT